MFVQYFLSIAAGMVFGFFISGLIAVIDQRSRERIFFGKKHLRENQEAWDEYCKDMTFRERQEYFMDWVILRKVETGHTHLWIPNRFHTKPAVQECVIDGVYYRGTIEQISEQSGVSLDVLKSINEGILPEYLNTK